MIELYKLTNGLYDDQVISDFLDLRPSRVRGHRYNRLNVRTFSFKLRVTDQWNNLAESVISATSINILKAMLDKYWKDSQLMFDKDNDIHELASVRSNRRTHPSCSVDDDDLMPDA